MRLIDDAEELERVVPAWEALAARDPRANAFQHPAWLAAWWPAFGYGRLHVIAWTEGPHLVALAPFVIAPEKDGGGLRMLGFGNTDQLDVIHDPARADGLCEALWEYLAWFPDARSGSLLANIPAGSPLLHPPPHLGTRVVLDTADVSPAIPLPATVEEFSNALPRGLRRTLRRARMTLEDEAPLTFEYRRGAEAGPLLDELCRLHERRWHDRDRTSGVLSDPDVQRFHRRVVREGRDTVRFFAVRHGGRVIAVMYALCWNGRVLAYLSGFDPDVAAQSPGSLVIEYAIRSAIEAGMREFDFLRGAESYKYTWGARDRPLYTVRVLSDDARAAPADAERTEDEDRDVGVA